MAGKHLEKSSDSLCVVNIIPPRELWEVIQPLRNKYTINARCGPHITFLDPFVLSHQYNEARQVLETALSQIEPFEIRFEKFKFFKHKQSSTLFLEPLAPAGAFDRLMHIAVEAFPQCNDQLSRGEGKWVPHLSIGNFKNHNDLLKVMEELQRSWKPLSFTLKEVYLLSRPGPDPFEVKAVSRLGRDLYSVPHFGSGSEIYDEKIARTLVVAALHKRVPSNHDIVLGFESIGIRILDEAKIEVILNPDGSKRNCAIIEFDSREQMLAAFEAAKYSPPFPGIPAFARPLELMAFPGVVGGCTKLNK